MTSPLPSILRHWELLPLSHKPGNSILSVQTETCSINIWICVPKLHIHSYSCCFLLIVDSLFSHTFHTVLKKRADSLDVLWGGHMLWQLLPAIYPGPLTVPVSRGSLPRTVKTSVTAAAIFLCGQSVRWRCCLLASWHGTHGYLQQQCSLTGKWSRSPSKLSSVSPGSALPDCSDSQSDITKCQPPLPPPPSKKINIPNHLPG